MHYKNPIEKKVGFVCLDFGPKFVRGFQNANLYSTKSVLSFPFKFYWKFNSFLGVAIHGYVKSTVIERRQHQLGRMADFPPTVTFSFFDLKKHEVPQIKSQTMPHTLMNLGNTTLPQKYGDQ